MAGEKKWLYCIIAFCNGKYGHNAHCDNYLCEICKKSASFVVNIYSLSEISIFCNSMNLLTALGMNHTSELNITYLYNFRIRKH